MARESTPLSVPASLVLTRVGGSVIRVATVAPYADLATVIARALETVGPDGCAELLDHRAHLLERWRSGDAGPERVYSSGVQVHSPTPQFQLELSRSAGDAGDTDDAG